MNELTPLITNLATNNRNYVFFVGAGFSKDAGIMSGWDILIETLKKIYINENIEDPQNQINLSNEKVEEWYLSNQAINQLGYSEILGLLYKTELERSEYLAQFFQGRMPGSSHRSLAKLIMMGVVRFIFTTNFDDLLEKALDEHQIDYDVIFSDDTLQKNPSWDKVKKCRIYKLHGDYKMGGLKNTVYELSSLEPRMAQDFQYIIDRHGMVVVGYAGKDSAVMEHFFNRNPFPYPMYWQYVKFEEDDRQNKLLNKLKIEYEKAYNGAVTFVQDNSASNLLGNIITGIEKLDLMLKTSNSQDINYDTLVIDCSSQKVRANSHDIIQRFTDIYSQHNLMEQQNNAYIYKYEIFSKLIKETEFILRYISSLLKYNCDDEIKFMIPKIFNPILQLNEYGEFAEFIKITYPYYLVMHIGALMIKNDKENLVDCFTSFEIKYNSYEYDSMMSIISRPDEGWAAVKEKISNRSYPFPKFMSIRNHLLLDVILQKDFDNFDSYITLHFLINDLQVNWINGSCYIQSDSFIDMYKKYFSDKINTEGEIRSLETRFYSKYKWLDTTRNSFAVFIEYLRVSKLGRGNNH